MPSSPYNPAGEYQPESILKLPLLFAWPPRPLAALRWLCFDMLFPWGHLFIGLAFVSWYYLPPSLASMAEFAPGWVAQIWLRNAVLLTLVAGGLHWWLYMRRGQQRKYKYHDKWPATDNKMFLWGATRSGTMCSGAFNEWEADGSNDIHEVARERTRQILKQHYPKHISAEMDQKLRDQFDIRLHAEAMEQQ